MHVVDYFLMINLFDVSGPFDDRQPRRGSELVAKDSLLIKGWASTPKLPIDKILQTFLLILN